MKGGYQIVDLDGMNINSTEATTEGGFTTTIKGIWDLIEGTTKPCLFENFFIDGVYQKPFFGALVSENDGYTVYRHDFTIKFLSTTTDKVIVKKVV